MKCSFYNLSISVISAHSQFLVVSEMKDDEVLQTKVKMQVIWHIKMITLDKNQVIYPI
jgi:hypothetical protein